MIGLVADLFHLLAHVYALFMIAILARLAMVAFGPWPLAVVSGLSLLDAANCIYEGHSDWWFPALVALIIAVHVSNEDRGPTK